jgi:V8-like Glu-specific endopeptidase
MGRLTPQEMADAQPMPLPTTDVAPSTLLDHLLSVEPARHGHPGYEPGSPGSGEELPSAPLPDPIQPSLDADVEPSAYGTSLHPYTTARVSAFKNLPTKFYPYRAAGKLFFKDGGSSYVCTGSLIKPGVVVTAAHCVCDFGSGAFYSDWEFVPAQYQDTAPYGMWTTVSATVMTSYLIGTETCAQPGVVCPNDVAVLVLQPKGPAGAKFYAGDNTGWLGYGWGGFGFTNQDLTLVSQLGYPVSHDAGTIMQRTDSQGFVDAGQSNNTVWGSRQTGGSSGGPEIVNLGIRGQLNTPLGTDEDPNMVIGVTSWGYTDARVKQQGASPFTSGNIVPLVNAVCGDYPAACD